MSDSATAVAAAVLRHLSSRLASITDEEQLRAVRALVYDVVQQHMGGGGGSEAAQVAVREALGATDTYLRAAASKPPAAYSALAGPQASAPLSRGQATTTSTPAPLAQDYIIPQQPVVNYREVETNVHVNSGDRDWFTNRGESRYAFTIQFDRVGGASASFSPMVQRRFRDVVRVELVKMVLPAEGLGTRPRLDSSGALVLKPGPTALALPYVAVLFGEGGANTAGSNERADRAFGLLHYDNRWGGEGEGKGVGGYLLFAPKYLRCVRDYAPTPLATLQRLSVRLERPQPFGALLSEEGDVAALAGVRLVTSSVNSSADGFQVANLETPATLVALLTARAFVPGAAWAVGETALLQGDLAPTTAAGSDMASFLKQAAGHVVVAVGHVDASTGSLLGGADGHGLCNVLFLAARHTVDPLGAGTYERELFGGSASAEATLSDSLWTRTPANAAAMNAHMQTQLVLRVVTRELDATGSLRPDNAA